jgi:hypothetical protein
VPFLILENVNKTNVETVSFETEKKTHAITSNTKKTLSVFHDKIEINLDR